MTRPKTAANSDRALKEAHHHRPRPSTSISSLDPTKAADRRLKARERQRRKRERDKQNSNRSLGSAAYRTAPTPPPISSPLIPDVVVPKHDPHPVTTPPMADSTASSVSATEARTRSFRRPYDDNCMTEEEITRRERVRESARLRQQKHRALVKQRKLVELGLAMNPDGLGGLEEVHYAINPDGTYTAVLPPPPPQQGILQDPHGQTHHQTGFPIGHSGGATFASSLLLSFTSAPLIKQHILRTLHMTNEELTSLEPVIAAAWDQWDHARRMHYAEQAAKANQQHQNGASGSTSASSSSPGQTSLANLSNGHSALPVPSFALPLPPPGVDTTSLGNDYRERFHRPLTAPSLFGTGGQVNTLNGTGPATSITAASVVPPGMTGIHVTPPDGDEGTVDSDSGREDGDGDPDADADADADGDADADLDMYMIDSKDDEHVEASI